MLDGRDHNMELAGFLEFGRYTLEHGVVPFAASGGEDNIVFLAGEHTGHLTACILYGACRISAQLIERPGVAILLRQVGQHCLQDYRIDHGSRRIKITAVTYGMTLPKKYQTEMQSKLAVAQAQMEAIVARMNEVVSSNAEA